MIDALSSDRLIAYVPILLPLLIALSGWLTLKLAQWSALFPRHFIGIPPYLGWQGYFFSRMEDYVNHWSRGLLDKLGTLDQVFEYIGPEKIISHQLSRLRPQIDSFIDDVMTSQHQVLWENLPILVKNRFYSRAHRMLPRMIDDIVEELGDSMRRLVTYPQLLHYAEQDAPGTLERLYRQLYERAFRRLAWFAAGLGLLAGLAQLLAGWLLNSDQILYWGLTGAFLGVAYFWCAQRWVQTPMAPIVLGRIRWRSLTARLRARQDRELADLLATTVLSPRNIARTLVLGGKARHAQIIIKRRISPLLEDINVRTIAQLTVGPIGYVNLKQSLADKLTESFLEPFDDDDFSQGRSKVLAEYLYSRIENLPDPLFYQQMKWALDPLAIIGTCGGFILGGLMGCAQWLLLFF